jgi:hypothetical protein
MVGNLLYTLSQNSSVLGHFIQTCNLFVDDIIIFSRDHDEQKRHLTKVLQALQRAGMTIAENKCSFGVPSVSFLGHLVSKDGISPLPDRVHDILNISSPTNITKVRSFLGLVNFYNRFIPKLAHHARPLTDLLRKRSRFQWSESHQNAFEKLKTSIAHASNLAAPQPHSPVQLVCDASDYGISGILQQRQGNCLYN